MSKLGDLIRTFRDKIRGVLNLIPHHIREYAAHSLHVTTAIKSFLESPVADIITAIIPTDIDDKVRAQLLTAINKAMPYLMIVDTCKDETDTEKLVLCWVKQIKYLPKDVQNALLAKFAAKITALLDDNELRQSSYDYAIQLLYTASKP